MRRLAIFTGLLLVSGAMLFLAAFQGRLGERDLDTEVSSRARPAAQVTRAARSQRSAAERLGASSAKQILFGDLHVHTTYSMDAFLTSLPMMQGEGAHPPADACDFARHCSALDFYSINDHAEGLTPAMWSEIKESVRRCNEVSARGPSPDLVAFVGWEWTQMGLTPGDHYGHKNVILRDTEEDRVPTRPIAALGQAFRAMRSGEGNLQVMGLMLADFGNRQRYLDFLGLRNAVASGPVCRAGVPVRDLPADCAEAVATPRELFERLDEWGFPSIVIPHGNAWGNTTPAGIDWEKQLARKNHDPQRQRLVEVYSGHGNSEPYRPWRHVLEAADGTRSCPAPSEGFTPQCHRAGEIVRERCARVGLDPATCEERSRIARENFVAAGAGGVLTVPGETAEDWLDAGQCTDCFEPAFLLRPGGSAQYALALSAAGVPETSGSARDRFRFGFIASSDNHTARPATGYKEFRAVGMTDALDADGPKSLRSMIPMDRKARPESIAIDPAEVPIVPGAEERLSSFMYTGGLVAVHAEGRHRDAIWSALERKEVYGTSGPRILLWFELTNGPDGAVQPMGGELAMSDAPRFSVRAVGSQKQLPGCPSYVGAALSAERLEALCFGECHHPSDQRRVIERIEVIRIRPRVSRDEDVALLVEDPWRTFECEPSQAGCSMTFEDPDFAVAGRDSVYYVRAVEEPGEHVNADNLRCERDGDGRCVATRPCRSGDGDECLAPERARAWSSPIFVDFAGRG